MPALLPDVDPDGLYEYSVVYTDRALNHMSESFQRVMNDISSELKKVYRADTIVVVPGSGTFAMEAVARQFATDKRCMVIRNGWFSYRWTQIFNMGDIPSDELVLKARPTGDESQAPFAPPAIDEVVMNIKREEPDVVFAPHVETSAGMMLPDSYIKAVADAVHQIGGLFVLDCIASGAIWVDMKACGVDALITAPQKGWSGSPCAGIVMLSKHGKFEMERSTSSSFACDLKKWHQIMQAYEKGGHAYHATMPTDALTTFRNAIRDTQEFGLDHAKESQQVLGNKIRSLLEGRGFRSVAAEGFKSPGVVVSYTGDDGIYSGQKFRDAGLQIAKGVPLRCNEPDDFKTFRLGLFGLDKLKNVERTVKIFNDAMDQIV